MGLFRGAVFRHGGGARKQPIKQPTEMPTSTMALMGRFPSSMGRFPTLMGRFPDFVLRGRFASWKSTGKQPVKKRGIKRILTEVVISQSLPFWDVHCVLCKIQRAENGVCWIRRGWIWHVWGAPIFLSEVPKPFKTSILRPLNWKSGHTQNRQLQPRRIQHAILGPLKDFRPSDLRVLLDHLTPPIHAFFPVPLCCFGAKWIVGTR